MGLEFVEGCSDWVVSTGELTCTSDAGGEDAAEDGSERGVGRLALVVSFGRGKRGIGNLFCGGVAPGG
jgi:hypothetical protein